jgi:PKD repeat protein
MKQFTFKVIAFTPLLLASFGVLSQESRVWSNPKKNAVQSVMNTEIMARGSAVTNCSDKINYVGNSAGPFFIQLGGAQTSTSNKDGLYQVFPQYRGNVIAVEFDASKYTQTFNTPVVDVRLFDVNASGVPLWGSPIGPIVSVPIGNTAYSTYTATFPTPVTISGNYGFAVGIINWTTTDSVKLYPGPTITGASVYYSYLTVAVNANTYNFPSYFANQYNAYMLIRPIVTTSVNPNWLTTKTSTGCGVPAVFKFDNTSPLPSSYVTNTLISPVGLTNTLSFGDSSPTVTFPSTINHTYTTVGNYVANYTQTYIGWTSNCSEALTTTIVVDDPKPAFTYTANGLTVNFSNTSQNLNSFIWNFGDLSTSTQQNPGSHTYLAPGTYVVELEGTAPCGKVKAVVSIVVTSDVGIGEESSFSEMITVFPNPANDVLNVTFSGKDQTQLNAEIYNSLGVMVKSPGKIMTSSDNGKIIVSDLPDGIYILKLKNGSGESVRSFIKQ